jgi:glycosyltransferase involved in cell wall biosynthesis
MNVLSVAFPLLTVSADSAGGAEQILWHLERGLVNAGNRSIVIAAKGSSVSGCLVPTPCANHEITEEVRRAAHRAHRKAIQLVLETNSIDLIHFHGLDFAEYVPTNAPPMLATLHLPVNLYPRHIFQIPGLTINFVSQSQAASLQAPIHGSVVCNGIDLSQYRKPANKEKFLLILARVCPEKGIDVALRVAHRLGLELVVAGPVHPFAAHQAYFEQRVKPLLDSKRHYIGPIGLQQKIDLLARARCLLAPSSIAETSSLVAMEAIASGTPVVARRSGALPEIVEQGVTGFLVDSEEEMAHAVERIDEITSESCRAAAASRFDANRMVREYLSLYERLRLRTIRQRGIG